MANLCDNTLTITVTTIPSWYKPDPEYNNGISIPDEERFLFLHDNIDDIEWSEEETPDGIHYTVILNFETKWAPPVTLYEKLVEDPTVVEFNAVWYEPGCLVLGYANKDEWIVDEECPKSWYSDILDVNVLNAASDTYSEINGTLWILFSEYQSKIDELRHSQPVPADQAENELKEISEYFC